MSGWTQVESRTQRVEHQRAADEPATAKPAELSDRDRRQRRSEIRRKLAESAVGERRRQDLVAAIAEATAKLDQLASDHTQACQPLQDDLARIEKQQVDAVLERRPADAKLDAKRKQLLDDLATKNADLERAVADEKAKLAVLEKERYQAAVLSSHASTLQAELLKLASPQCQLQMRHAQYELSLCGRRVDKARDALVKFPHDHEFWTFELTCAEQLLAEASQRERDAVQAALDE